MELDDVRRAWGALDVDADSRARALRNLEAWWIGPQYAVYRPQLRSLGRRAQWELLLDSFHRVIPFGTGGRRGPVGIGPNRINPETVVTSVQGHASYLRRQRSGAALRVVVAFDVRVFRDLRALYDPAISNPLLGMSSRDLARAAAAVYAANGIAVYTVRGDGEFFLSTPELSFAIRHLQAHGGLNISASHNHPDDNGAKFYAASGGQPVPPDDEDLAREVESVTAVPPADFAAAVEAGHIRWWDAALHERYIAANLACRFDPNAIGARVAYSPLHGTGRYTVAEVLPRAGFELRVVAPQWQPDGAFSGVKFRIPNPEVPQSMEAVMALAQECGADIALATDPDADRLGVVAPADGSWRVLSGNEIAVLLAAYIIETRRELGTMPARAFIIKTAVTTELLAHIAAAHGIQVIGDLLVGFKYVGAVLDAIERDGSFGALRAGADDFLLAAEESNGVLVSSVLREKDAAGGALLLAELCARLRHEGRRLGDYLDDVYRRYGYAANLGYSFVLEGVSGLQRTADIMQQLRQAPPPSVGGRSLQRHSDRWDEISFGPFRSETDRSARNLLQLEYDGGLRIAVRPSGTEPKIKLYVEQLFPPQPSWKGAAFTAARGTMDDATTDATLGFVDCVLRAVGIELPRSALLLSPLVSLEQRMDFARRFLPELEEQLAHTPDADALAAWADRRLQAYGKDARELVAAGVQDHFALRNLPEAQRRTLAASFASP